MIFKIKKVTPPYTQVHNNIIDNPDMSGKAKWILIYLLSKPENWSVYEKDISNHCTDGRDSIRSGIKELMDAGYIARQQQRDKLGKFKGYEYNVYEIPQIMTKSYRDGFSVAGESNNSNTNISKTDIVLNVDWDLLRDKRERLEERFREIDETMIQKDIERQQSH